MGTTPNYALETFSISEYGSTFGTFLSAVVGPSASNMTKIDTQMKTNADNVAIVFNEPIKRVFGAYISTSYYEALVSSYSAYVSGNVFLLILDTAVTGTTTININSIGITSIMKYNSSGTLVNLSANDITAGQPHLIVYDGLEWVLCGRTSADQISATGGTVQSKLDAALYPANVVDNLTSTSTNTPLSANQGKVLNDGKQTTITATGILKGAGAGSISAASAGTDYADPTKIFYPNNAYGAITSTDFDAITVSGFYYGLGSATGAPNSSVDWFLIHTNNGGATTSAVQTAISATTLEKYTRKKATTWGNWYSDLPSDYSASFLASGWSESAPYTQTVSVSGVVSTDTPIVDVILSATAETAMSELENYVYFNKIDTGAGEITATCYDTVPTVDISLRIKVVR